MSNTDPEDPRVLLQNALDQTAHLAHCFGQSGQEAFMVSTDGSGCLVVVLTGSKTVSLFQPYLDKFHSECVVQDEGESYERVTELDGASLVKVEEAE